MEEKKRDIYYFAGTHWDREWYQTFQQFRYRLVDMLDELVETMENDPSLGVFHLDGQTIVIEDYAEINPEGAERLKKLVEQGRVKIGPWYVMPDEFLVSGESLIRNLMIGHRLSKKWGAEEAWKFGYICDIFGHIAQTPQIMVGFGIPYSLFCRGFGGKTEPYFIWQSPDGSECINFRLGDKNGYGEFCLQVLSKVRYFIDDTDENIKKRMDEYMKYLITLTKYPVHVVMDALDHMPLHKDTNKYLKWIEAAIPDANVHQVDLREAGKKLEQYRDQMQVVKGEMNLTNKDAFGHLITNTLSSYYPIKQSNDRCQNRLEKVIEPLLVYGKMTGHTLNRRYADLAYRYLIQNHPHDSICGCSIDQVHKDMTYRFDQVSELCDVMQNAYLWKDQRPYLEPEKDEKTDCILTVYNPLPTLRDEVVEASVEMRTDYPYQYAEPFGYEMINSFRLLDENGTETPYQIVKIRKNQIVPIVDQHNRGADVYTIAFRAKLPAGGKAEYRIVPSEKPVRYLRHMTSGQDFMENEYVKIRITPNGSITLEDKRTGKTYENQLNLADDIEIGDGWFHAPAVENRICYSYGTDAQIEKVQDGVCRCVFQITKEWKVPASASFLESTANDTFSKQRSEETVVCRTVFEVGLSQNARHADVTLRFDNRAKDHRLRLMMPTKTEGDTYFAGQAFYCCERKTGINYDSGDWIEPSVYEKAMNGIVGKRNADGSGLALVAAEGLHECAGYDDADGTIAVTLLRAFRHTVNTNGQTRGQLQGEHRYHFYLMPLSAAVTYADLLQLQNTMAAGILTGCREVLPKTKSEKAVSMIEVTGKSVVTSVIKCAEDQKDAVVVRVWNASDAETTAKIAFAKEIKDAKRVNLNEETQEGALHRDGNAVTLPLTPWKIASVMVKL